MVPVVIGLAAGIGLIAAFMAYPIQTQYDKNLVIISNHAACTDPECAYDSIASCNIGITSVVPSHANFVWIIEISQDEFSCIVEFDHMNLASTDPQYSDFTRYTCRITPEEVASVGGNTIDGFIKNIINFQENRCGAWVPPVG